MNKYINNSSRRCVLGADREYSKELLKLYDDYSLSPDEVEIKKTDYQRKIADLYSIPNGNVKKLVHNFFDKEKYVFHY